jgi:hypothetical protein
VRLVGQQFNLRCLIMYQLLLHLLGLDIKQPSGPNRSARYARFAAVGSYRSIGSHGLMKLGFIGHYRSVSVGEIQSSGNHNRLKLTIKRSNKKIK